MRVVGKLPSEQQAREFVAYLTNQQIHAVVEHAQDEYYVWVEDEDRLEEANEALKKFLENPEDIQVKVPEDPISLTKPRYIKVKKLGGAPLTKLLIGLCIFLFLFSYTQKPLPPFQMTALGQWLIFELPTEFPFFNGFYHLILSPQGYLGEPVFTQILDGQVWRLITPIFMHADFLHILFNMMWLWVLGRQVEERLGLSKYLILTLIAAIISNTAQYLMSGPFFIGYSGVVCALAGYIWIRQKVAPWEGYPIPRSTMIFLFIFIVGMVGVQIVSFIFTYTGIAKLPNLIANTAHIAGGITGICMGKLGWRRK